MTKSTLANGQSLTFTADQSGSDSLAFVGNTNASGQAPGASFVGANTLSGITDIGSVGAPGEGALYLMPNSSLTTGGLNVNGATLWINERPGASMTFNGTTQVANGSTLTAAGSGGTGKYIVNGSMNIDGSSTVNMDYVAINGTGTLHLSGPDALLRAGTVGAGETVVLDGGMLSLTNGLSFAGTITASSPATSRIGANSSVDIYNAMGAVQETFNRSTGVLDLFNAAGGAVASLKFAGAGDLYATPTTGLSTNYIAISSMHSASSLAATFAH